MTFLLLALRLSLPPLPLEEGRGESLWSWCPFGTPPSLVRGGERRRRWRRGLHEEERIRASFFRPMATNVSVPSNALPTAFPFSTVCCFPLPPFYRPFRRYWKRLIFNGQNCIEAPDEHTRHSSRLGTTR